MKQTLFILTLVALRGSCGQKLTGLFYLDHTADFPGLAKRPKGLYIQLALLILELWSNFVCFTLILRKYKS
jgi:hypothetical protein